MAEYIDRDLIEWYGCNFEEPSCKNRECSGCYHAECSHSQVMQIPTADVIERSKDKAIEEIEILQKYEFRRFSEDTMYHKALTKCLEILKRNIGE